MASISFNGTEIAHSVGLARSFGTRFMGLMLRRELPAGGGLLLSPCNSIHMCFMRMPLDIVYLSQDYRVLHVEPGLKPWRVGALVKGCRHVLELNAGTVEQYGITAGGKIAIRCPISRSGNAVAVSNC